MFCFTYLTVHFDFFFFFDFSKWSQPFRLKGKWQYGNLQMQVSMIELK